MTNNPRTRVSPINPKESSGRSASQFKDKSGYFWNHPVAILYEDKDVMVFDKPAGVLTIANPKELDKNLVDLVNHQYCRHDSSRRKNKRQGAKSQLFPCHRLDQETSGAIVFAKSLDIQHKMMELFKSRDMAKKYIACVQGQLKKKSGEIRSPIKEEGKMKPSVSVYQVSRQKESFAVVEVQPMTGRTNQIRIHFSRIGHPLVGDRKFSIAKNFPVRFKRTALHASELQWKSPFTGKTITVESPLPEDMKKLMGS